MSVIKFSPVTRLSGLLSVDVVVEGNKVVDARVKGDQFRGFEWMLAGREITDAPYFTERICGICSFAHGVTSAYLLDALFADEVPEQAQVLRNIMQGLEILQNHIRHFYVFYLPDFIVLPDDLPYQGIVTDRRFDAATTAHLVESYLLSFPVAAKAHEAQTLFGGKAPHQHGVVHGGITVAPTADKVMRAESLVKEIRDFLLSRQLSDTELVAERYSDYYQMGWSAGRFVSFGLFRTADGTGTLWPAGRRSGMTFYAGIDSSQIEEDVTSAWYEEPARPNLAPDELPQPSPQKPGAYTFVKAVHYSGLPYECGPLARLAIAGKYQGRPSAMARVVARTAEAVKVADLVASWLRLLVPGQPVLRRNETPQLSRAVSLNDAPRGALLHAATLDGSRIERYGIITPTVWNFSPLNRFGTHGPVEEALIGTYIANPMLPVEIGRIVRAFDPCLSCGTHIIRV